ncbi:uncharacterized protein LOC106648430 [Trichogramma pretiosum]|uniref:uncharacterized protein LOC106648430 n=1 Tax=Trichogramma pretiosum TaxID=7493 RepID=UPI000C719F5C|nr:uncharacterized protein LOC106648430 [Trichogramma pretiosum]XP_023315300.1 uncharacterized protein LOC106648430 [Trichogramma pretiosum]
MEIREVDTELILFDVLSDIFKHLSIYDLTSASEVCKSWYYTAKREKLKRGPQVITLQALEDLVATRFCAVGPRVKNQIVEDLKLSLRIRPRLGLFFTDGKYPSSADCDNVVYEICKTHRWTRPKDCFYIAIETVGVNIDDNPVGGEKNVTAALFFPVIPQVNYTITETNTHSIQQHFTSNDCLLVNMTQKLFDFKEDQVCFIVLMYKWQDEPLYERYHRKFFNKILESIKIRYKPSTYALWGGAVNDIFTLAPGTKPSYNATSFCAISISGNNVETWSIMVDINLSNTEIENKLKNFKNCINLNDSSIILLMLPSNKETIDRSKLKVFKVLFPKGKLLSLFNDKNNVMISVDSTSNENDNIFYYSHFYALLVLSYKC